MSRLTIPQITKFTQDVETLFQNECRGYGTNVQLGDLLRSILVLIRKHHIRIDANYATLLVNALCIESLAKTLVPSYNILDASRPFLTGYKKICQDGQCHKSIIRLRVLRRFMPIIKCYKYFYDYFFFERLDRERRKSRGRVLDGVRGLGGLLVICATARSYCEQIN